MVIVTATLVSYNRAATWTLATTNQAGFVSAVRTAPVISLGSYIENGARIDQNNDGMIHNQDRYPTPPVDAASPPAGEGLRIDGVTRKLSTFVLFRATLTNRTGTVVTNLELATYQFRNGTIAFRLADPALTRLAAMGIERNDIAELRSQNTHPVYCRSVAPVEHDNGFPCSVRGTLIQTSQGARPVEELVIGDLVVTVAGEHKPIRRVGSRVTP